MKASPLRAILKGEHPGAVPCIVKMHFGTFFYIYKAKRLDQTVEYVSKEVDRRIRLGVVPSHILYPIIEHVRKSHVGSFSYEVIFYSDDPLLLLQAEYNALQSAKEDNKCLNKSFAPYIPAWITTRTVDDFEKWKKTLKNATTKNNKTVSTRRGAAKKASVPDGKRRNVRVQSKPKNTRSIKEKPKADI